jgi:predicted dehydrogenase
MTLRIGLIGCGNISGEYMQTLSGGTLARVTACADKDKSRAQAFASQYGIPALSPESLIAHPEIDLILNLTPPLAHYAVSLAALQAGKHVYSEKPLALTFEQGKILLETAQQNGVTLACAPDTFLGRGIQTCRAALDAGQISEPVAASAFMTCHGHEDWHPAPDFYYQPGGGPLFDMGPYYLTALVHLLGSIRRVTAFARASFPTRTVTSIPNETRTLDVNVNTHYTASLEFTSGALATLVMSFDLWQASLPHLEIYGSAGTLSCPDPNTFDGIVRVTNPQGQSAELPLVEDAATGRGAGLLGVAASLQNGDQPQTSAELALHILETMTAIEESAQSGQAVELKPVVIGKW